MSFGYYNNLNTTPYERSYPNFRAQLNPAKNIENSIEKLAQKVDEEKEKKHNKAAIAVGSSVLGLSILVALFNPRISSGLIEKIKAAGLKSKQKVEQSKSDSFTGKFYKAVSAGATWIGNFVSWTNNYNSVKDTYFKKLCTEEKNFFSIHNLKRRNSFKKIDRGFRRIFKKPHETLTKWGDMLAKHTVRNGYKNSAKRMNELEELLKSYAEKLPDDKKLRFEEKLAEIHTEREFFSNENLDIRFKDQEKLLENLNTAIRKRWRNYSHGFIDKNIKNTEHFNQNLSFWAQDMTRPERERLEKEGSKVIDGLIGNKECVKGKYNELLDIVSEGISADEKKILEKSVQKTEKSMRKAGKREFTEYFDKKRDLVLGSAPTDILTAIIGLSVGGVALASADDKDNRISKLITGIIPTMAGIGTTIALTAMLFSGVKGMLVGIATGGVLSLTGSRIDKYRLSLKAKITGEKQDNTDKTEKENV